jgi:hypothetical protein
MKRAPWYVVTGAVAGFAAVLGLRGLGGAPVVLTQPAPATGHGGSSGGGGVGSSPGASHPAGGGGGAQTRTATGTLVHYGYGELAVKVTVRGGRITGLSLATLRTEDPFSQQLADQDIPVLKSEVLRAHSAKINTVSGATFTSQAYLDSIQSALDKLNLG